MSVLTLSQTTKFRVFQTEKFPDDKFKFYENGREFSNMVENTFPTVFSKDLYCRHVQTRACLGKVNSLLNDKFFVWSKMEAFIDDHTYLTENLKIILLMVKNNLEKREKCWSLVFSPLLTIISKGLIFKVGRRQVYVLKG